MPSNQKHLHSYSYMYLPPRLPPQCAPRPAPLLLTSSCVLHPPTRLATPLPPPCSAHQGHGGAGQVPRAAGPLAGGLPGGAQARTAHGAGGALPAESAHSGAPFAFGALSIDDGGLLRMPRSFWKALPTLARRWPRPMCKLQCLWPILAAGLPGSVHLPTNPPDCLPCRWCPRARSAARRRAEQPQQPLALAAQLQQPQRQALTRKRRRRREEVSTPMTCCPAPISAAASRRH